MPYAVRAACNVCRTPCFVTPSADGKALSEIAAKRPVSGREAVGVVRRIVADKVAGRNLRPCGVPVGAGRREAEASAGGSAAGGTPAGVEEKVHAVVKSGETEPSSARDRAAKTPARGTGADEGTGAAGARGAGRGSKSVGGGQGAGHRTRPSGEAGHDDEDGPAAAVVKQSAATGGRRRRAGGPVSSSPPWRASAIARGPVPRRPTTTPRS